jgi:mono/diheme cytochrome c family protein
VTRLTATLFAASLIFSAAARAADQDRGRLLQETFCLGCHGDSVAKRENRLAKSYEELRRQVTRWQANSGLKWEPQEIDDVSAYLNATYYRFKCEAC